MLSTYKVTMSKKLEKIQPLVGKDFVQIPNMETKR